MGLRVPCSALATLAACNAFAQPVPRADHHQHLFSPAVAALISPAPPAPPVEPITASDLVALLDAAGIRRALILSVAYMFGSPNRTVENEYQKVMAENDWTSAEVAVTRTASAASAASIRFGTTRSRSWPAARRIRGSAAASSCTSETRSSTTTTRSRSHGSGGCSALRTITGCPSSST